MIRLWRNGWISDDSGVTWWWPWRGTFFYYCHRRKRHVTKLVL